MPAIKHIQGTKTPSVPATGAGEKRGWLIPAAAVQGDKSYSYAIYLSTGLDVASLDNDEDDNIEQRRLDVQLIQVLF